MTTRDDDERERTQEPSGPREDPCAPLSAPEGPEGAPPGEQVFFDLGGLSFRLDGTTMVSQHYVLDGARLTVGVEQLASPPPPWPPRPGEDARTRLARVLRTVRIRLSVA